MITVVYPKVPQYADHLFHIQKRTLVCSERFPSLAIARIPFIVVCLDKQKIDERYMHVTHKYIFNEIQFKLCFK